MITDKQRANVDAWATRLELNEDAQATGILKEPVSGGFCCIGVLSDQHLGEIISHERCHDTGTRLMWTNMMTGFHIDTEMTRNVFEELTGFDLSFQKTLIRMNDFERATFPEIARVIRQRFAEIDRES